MSIALVIILLVAAIILFIWEKFTVDIITIFLLVILMLTRILTPEEAFSGFGSEFIVILSAIFILSGAMQQTGVLDLIASKVIRLKSVSPSVLLFFMMLAVGIVSAFLNNTTVTAIFISPVIAMARNLKINPSKFLMPVAFASILGGTCTLIGTSTNVAVNGYMVHHGMEELRMFEFLPIGALLFFTGLIYMMLVGRHLMPDRKPEDFIGEYVRSYVSEVVILKNSPLTGQYIFESDLSKMGFRILNVIRGGFNFQPDNFTRIVEEDILIIEGKIDDLIKIKEAEGIDIRADILTENVLQSDKIRLAEVLVTPGSEFSNRSLKQMNFRKRFGLVALAISRSIHTIGEKIGNTVLRTGDIVLVQGDKEMIDSIKSQRLGTVIENFQPVLYKKRKARLTLIVFLVAILAGTSGIIPLSAALITAALIVVVSNAITIEKAYETIDWRLIVLIGGMSAFGTAMVKTGASEWLANLIVENLMPYGITTLMAGFIIITIILTQPMSNAAAALVVLPIAIQAAHIAGVNEKPFIIAVMMAASISLITPFEPSCILVYGPGKYRFADFLKVGSGLTVIILILLLFLIPYFYPY